MSKKAIKSKALNKAFKIDVPDEVYDNLLMELEEYENNKEKVLSFLGLATRAGKIVSGDDSTLLDLKKEK